METIRCLFFDDEESQRVMYSKWIVDGWMEMGFGSVLSVTAVGTVEAASTALEREDVDLLISDIIIKEEGEKKPLGLALINEARVTKPKLPIVALSIGNGGLEFKARKAGANAYISKVNVVEDGIRVLGEGIKVALEANDVAYGAVEDITVLVDERDMALVASVDWIGRENILSLLRELLAESLETVELGFVRPGISGAAVLSARCETRGRDGEGGYERAVLLKVSRDRGLMQDERAGARRTLAFPPQLFVRQVDSEVAEAGGWYGVACDFVNGATTFVEWIQREGRTVEEVRGCLEMLFAGNGLERLYRKSVEVTGQSAIGAVWSELGLWRGARVLDQLDELGSLVAKHWPDDLYDANMVEAFVRAKRLVTLDEERFRVGGPSCLSHGDLHTRNVIVDEGGRPNLVDTGNVRFRPWAVDLCRFVADLFLSGLDAGAASHEWERTEVWAACAGALVRAEDIGVPEMEGGDGTASERNGRVVAALSWLRGRARELTEEGGDHGAGRHEWEFMAGLGVEFLKGTYRIQELPSPKRALGAVAACIALREAASVAATSLT